MPSRERRDDPDERAQLPPKRHDEAQQEQQMVGAAEDVLEALHEESQHRLMPARIERDHAGVAFELEHALHTARAEEPHGVDDTPAETFGVSAQREQRILGFNRRLEL